MPIVLQMLRGLAPDQHEPFQRALLDAGLIHRPETALDAGSVVQQLDLAFKEALVRLTAASTLRTSQWTSLPAGRRLVVRQRAYQLCRRLKSGGVRFTPVVLP